MRCPTCFSPVGDSAYCAGCHRQLRPARRERRRKGDTSYLGHVIDRRFRVDGYLGRGLTAAVFVARDLAENRRVALRLVHPKVVAEPGLYEDFHDSLMRIRDLRDPHTIEIHAIGRLPDGTLYVVSELMEGAGLDVVIASAAPMPWPRALAIISQLCEPLHAAHARNFIHRRLTPSKIFLETRTTMRSAGGDPYRDAPIAIDFARFELGGVVAYRPPSPDTVLVGPRIGHTDYMSPEHLGGDPVDPRSDLFALGCIAYEMVTGVIPYVNNVGLANRLVAYLTVPLEPPSSRRGVALPAEAEAVIVRCLARSPSHRYADALALRDAIHQLAGG